MCGVLGWNLIRYIYGLCSLFKVVNNIPWNFFQNKSWLRLAQWRGFHKNQNVCEHKQLSPKTIQNNESIPYLRLTKINPDLHWGSIWKPSILPSNEKQIEKKSHKKEKIFPFTKSHAKRWASRETLGKYIPLFSNNNSHLKIIFQNKILPFAETPPNMLNPWRKDRKTKLSHQQSIIHVQLLNPQNHILPKYFSRKGRKGRMANGHATKVNSKWIHPRNNYPPPPPTGWRGLATTLLNTSPTA